MNRIERLWGRAEDLVIGLFSLIALGLVCFEVLARYFVPSILPDWGAELIVYLMVTAILIAGSPLVLNRRHIRADLFVRKLPLKLRVTVEFLNLLVGFAYCALIAKLGWDVVAFAKLLDVRSDSSLLFPQWIFYIALPLAFGLMAARYLIRIGRFVFRFDRAMLTDGDFTAS
ncbi:MAG: TRAP transporter small permease [Gammaproteobacteria bacterium]|nr:TRAP transporter small permease [Gammaproteobacteria bacterium]